MLTEYFPILLFIVVGVSIGLVLPLLGSILSRGLKSHKPDPEKLSPYECGFDAFEDARTKFDVRYYLVAILFIIFDIEVAFGQFIGRNCTYLTPTQNHNIFDLCFLSSCEFT